MILRPRYIDALRTYRNIPLVKILAGIRRCGKSTILEMLRDDLLAGGVMAEQVILMRYTSEELEQGMTDREMYQNIKSQMKGGVFYYLLLDEVQEIAGWEKAVNSLLENGNVDVQRNLHLSLRAVCFHSGIYPIIRRVPGLQSGQRTSTQRAAQRVSAHRRFSYCCSGFF